MEHIWLDDWLGHLAEQLPEGHYLASPTALHALLAILLVGIICGAVGSLVVGNRMAFFSDALAHCAFAGIGLGLLVTLLTGSRLEQMQHWILPIMIGFGILVGLGIAFVRDKTSLASDTVIGVFFAGAIGSGAVMLKWAAEREAYRPENFLFGDLVFITGYDLLTLMLLLPVVLGFLVWMNNRLVFASFSSSLALSRQIPVRLCHYLFIAVLAVIVNVCLKTVGALLINAFLVVPAATAANLCRNMRQLFWCSIAMVLLAGILGHWISWQTYVATRFHPTESGTIVVLSVVLFFLSMAIGPWLRERRPRPEPKREQTVPSGAA
jgi:zinc transport system permease protein